MDKVTKEIKIGIAFIIAIFLLYFGISFLRGINLFTPSNTYNVVFDDVAGLTASTPITINGLEVGKVYSIQLDENNPRRVLTKINMNKGIDIPIGSKFVLDVQMLGGAVIYLKVNYDSNNYYTGSDTIVGTRHKGALDSASDLIPEFAGLIPKLDSILTGIQVLVNDSSLVKSVKDVNTITNNLAQSTQALNIMLTNLNKDVPTITSNLATSTGNLSKLSNDLQTMDLVSTYQSVDSTMKNIQYLSSKLTTKDNTIGLLLNDKQMYDSINSTISNASQLLKDVKDNPQRYINVKVF